MAKIIYVQPDGTRQEVDVPKGYSLMEGAINNDIPGITGECGGSLACGTCHVHIDEFWREAVGPPPPMEESMLEFATGVNPSSRLCCQIFAGDELDGLVVRVPPVGS